MIFINEREGDNWWGTSMLRAPYKHWYYKNNFYKIDAIAFERQGIGIPRIKMPAGYTDSDEQKAERLGRNLRANETAVAIVPQGYEIDFMDMGSSTTRDPENSINHHNKEILQSFLAQFLELGSTKAGGSRALSSDHSDLFLHALTAVAETITNPFNKDLIPELVDLNFNDVTVYPVLDFSGIKKVDIAALGAAIASLSAAGALHPTKDDEQYLRATLGLPARSQEDIDEITNNDPSSQDLKDNVDIESPAGDDDEEEAEIEEPAGAPEEQEPDDKSPAAAKKVNKAAKNAKPETTNNPTKKPAKPAKPGKPVKKPVKKEAHEHKPLLRTFDDGKGFKSWRPLSFAESKVDFQSISDRMDALEAAFGIDATKLLKDAKDAFMKALHTALDNGDHAAVADLEATFVDSYSALLKATMKTAYEAGKKGAAAEMTVGAPSTSADTIASLNVIAETIAQKTATDLETKAKLTAINAIRQDKPPLQTAGQIDAELDQAIEKAVDGTSGVIVGQAWNAGRNDVFQKNADDIHGLQRSEILDDATCAFCLSIDGYVVSVDDSWASTDILHDNCRGIWVEILKDEQNPPEVTGIPDEIGQYYGGKPNDLKQPRKPIVRPGSLAEQEVQRRKNAS